MHEGIKYKCEFCDYEANRTDRLKTHVQTVHEGFKYFCEFCNFEAARKDRLKKHLELVHERVNKYEKSEEGLESQVKVKEDMDEVD